MNEKKQRNTDERRTDKFIQQIEAEEFKELVQAVLWLNQRLRNKQYSTVSLKKNEDATYLAFITFRVYVD